jgi:flagellar assembly protein FliH
MADAPEKIKADKFMFDLHIFDEDHEEEPEEPEEPPPPTFSEEELENAREEGYIRGRREAEKEAEESREKFIAAQLEMLAKNFPLIFETEKERERRYEEETLRLVREVLKKLFPAMNQAGGYDEVFTVVKKVLKEQEEQSEIKIEVSDNSAEDLRKHMKTIISEHADGRIEIIAAQDIGPGDCRINWKDGGAVRDAGNTVLKIEAALEQLLAARGAKVRYSKVDKVDDAEKGKNVSEEAEPIQPEDNYGDT